MSESDTWSFVEHATDYLLQPRMGDKRHPSLWPSEATAIVENEYKENVVVGKCRRATFFRYLTDNYEFYDKYSFYEPLVSELEQKKLPPDRYMLWVWKAGQLYEDYLINIAKESGIYIAGQTSVYVKQYNVAGKIDIVVVNPRTHKLTNVEAKSVYGFGGNAVLGTPGQRSKGILGVPRESNLMQLAIYHWWNASVDDAYEASRLTYGSRDTGRYAEYTVWTETTNDQIDVWYKPIAPIYKKLDEDTATKSGISINSILEQYKFIQTSLDGGTIPERDYNLKYSDEYLAVLYERDLLSKTDKEKYEKHQEYITGQRARKISPLIKGDWQCNLCNFKNICYKNTDIKHKNYGIPKVL